MIAADENFASVDDVMEEATGFMCCKKFLFDYSVFELNIVEFLREGADDLLCSNEFLFEHCSHDILLRGIQVDDKSSVWVRVDAQDGDCNFGFDFVECIVCFLPPDKWYVFLCQMVDGG